jgi:hypothetical protein
MRGHIKVTKIYDDHHEVVVDDNNMLVNGFVVDIISVLTGEAMSVPSITPGYFQIGIDGVGINKTLATSDVFYHLSSPLSAVSQYGDGTSLELQKLNRSFMASTEDGGTTYTEMLYTSAILSSTVLSSAPEKSLFAPIPERDITKDYLDSIEVRLELNKSTANGVVIKEFGLFSSNPGSYKKDKPFLVAYKSLSDALTKRGEFSLLVEWSIGFLGATNIYDNITPGFK